MLNINRYEIKAKYIPTKRQRTVTVDGRSEEDAISRLGSDYTDIKSVTLKMNPPSERQISYAQSLGIVITDDMCAEDVSCLISSKTDDRLPPKQGLIDFADAHNIVFSNYIGKKRLYYILVTGLPKTDMVAFFIFSIYRHLSDDRESNLDKSLYKKYFYEFAYTHENEDKFMKSLYDNYSGVDFRFFGTLKIRDGDYERCEYGGSTQTYAFKCAKQYLIDVNLINANAQNSKTIKKVQPEPQFIQDEENYEQYLYKTEPQEVNETIVSKNSSSVSAATKTTGSGCLLPIIAILFSVFFFAP